MGKFTIAGLAIALALILGLGTPRPVAAQDSGIETQTTGGGEEMIMAQRESTPQPAPKWVLLSGKALDISAGAGGSVWIIGTDNSPYKYNGSNWTKTSTGKALRIDVGTQLTSSGFVPGWVWLVGTDRYAYFWKNNKWNGPVLKTISDIAIGGGKAWALGTDKKDKYGFTIYRFTGVWSTRTGASGIRIDVDSKGNAWVLNKIGLIVTWTGKGWQRLVKPYKGANDISIGANDTVWVSFGGGTAFWNGTSWVKYGPSAKPTSIAVDKGGLPWVITDKTEIWALK